MPEFYCNGKSVSSLEQAQDEGKKALAANSGWNAVKIYKVIGIMKKTYPPVEWVPEKEDV